jgi:hypothetical protein
MSITRRRCLLWLAATLVTISSGLAQTKVPFPPDSEQLSVWKVLYPEWFEQWDTAETRCNIDDPTEYKRVRLEYGADMSLDDRTASKQIEELDKRIVAYLRNRGWSPMKLGGRSGIPDLKRCFQKSDSIVQIYQITGRCTANSPCKAYDGFALTFYIPLQRGEAPIR